MTRPTMNMSLLARYSGRSLALRAPIHHTLPCQYSPDDYLAVVMQECRGRRMVRVTLRLAAGGALHPTSVTSVVVLDPADLLAAVREVCDEH